MMHKAFDKELYDKHSYVERIVQELINISHHTIIKNPVIKKIDLLVLNDDQQKIVGGIEVEQWTEWKYFHGTEWKEDYPFPVFHIFHRKKKFFATNNFFIGVSKDAKGFYLLHLNSHIEDYCKLQKIKCKNTDTEEWIYIVPRQDEKGGPGISSINNYLEAYFNERC
jgi:hypothetical protein